jgi:hypothetical protein
MRLLLAPNTIAMLTVTRIRIQYLNGENVTKQEIPATDELTFYDHGELERFRKVRQAYYQGAYDSAHPDNATEEPKHRTRVSVLFNIKEDNV